jgi:hypothetical protein
MPENKPYAILLIAKYYSSAQTEMECAITTRGMFASAEEGNEYCEKMLDYYFPASGDKHFDRRYSFVEISQEQFDLLSKLEVAGTGLIFVHSLE